ncbi:MAG: type IV secretion system protein [Alphaproteobacteria bacterium]|nr:type IV secretion system protein [Alphaproteobacteria bacterium]
MVSILGTLFKYKEKESPDELGLFPERVHVDAFPERRYLWTSRFFVITTCLSICFNMLMSSIIYAMLPCFHVTPRLFRINNNINQVELVERDEIYYYASDLIAEQYIRDYIMLRYTVTEDYAELKDRWRKNSIFYWYSTEEVYNEFLKKDAETVYDQFKTIGLQRYVEIIWTKHVTRSMWMVQFKTYDITRDNPRPKVDVWRATLRIGYATGLMKFRKPEDRILNPYGFMVYSYTLSYLGDAHNGPSEVPSHLKYNMMML